MNLYCFKPYNWLYCGGMVLIVARDWEECLEAWIEYQKGNRENEEITRDSSYRYQGWMLCHTYSIQDTDVNKGVQFVEYNYA